ncbi:MAG TPA: hypothetical protein VNS32_08920 [Flavisolibacter sp.]|nr:hypothetical protein [Flavisolibacter sp.]
MLLKFFALLLIPVMFLTDFSGFQPEKKKEVVETGFRILGNPFLY